MTSIFGAFVAGWQVEQAMIAHLREWMPDYLPHYYRAAQTVLDRSLPPFPLPRSYTTVPREPDRWKEDQLPAILIVSPGLAERPRQDGQGNYRGTYEVSVGAICSTGDEATSKLFADLYLTAAAMICLDKPSLGGVVEDTTIETIENDWYTGERNRTLAATAASFNVTVPNLLTVTGGPPAHLSDPDTDPGDFEVAETTELDLQKTDPYTEPEEGS